MSKPSPIHAKAHKQRYMPFPFCIDQHSWVPHEWLTKYAESNIIRNFGEGQLALVKDEGGYNVDKESAKELANPQTPVTRWSKEFHAKETRRFFDSDRTIIDELVLQASVNTDALTCLSIKMTQILTRIEALALAGNTYALSEIFDVAIRVVGLLNSTASRQPDLIKRFAGKCHQWPVITSLHPGLCEDSEFLLRQIELGKRLPVQLEKSTKWKLDEAGRIAWKLLFKIWNARSENRDQSTDYGSFVKVVDELPQFCDKQSASKWWDVGREMLLLTYPNPEAIPELARLVTAASHRKSPGRIRQRILEIIKSRFLAFASK